MPPTVRQRRTTPPYATIRGMAPADATSPDPAEPSPPEPEAATATDDEPPEEPPTDDLAHDARVELDAWRASFRMDPTT